jgi:hypothetical protein
VTVEGHREYACADYVSSDQYVDPRQRDELNAKEVKCNNVRSYGTGDGLSLNEWKDELKSVGVCRLTTMQSTNLLLTGWY